MLLSEFNEKVFKAGIRQEGIEEARADAIERLLAKGKSPEEIHELMDYPMEEIELVVKSLQ